MKANEVALASIKGGATMLSFNVSELNGADDLAKLLKGIDLNTVGVRFLHAKAYLPIVKEFVKYVETNGFDKKKVMGGTGFDAIAYLMRQNKFYRSKEEDLGEALELVKMTEVSLFAALLLGYCQWVVCPCERSVPFANLVVFMFSFVQHCVPIWTVL